MKKQRITQKNWGKKKEQRNKEQKFPHGEEILRKVKKCETPKETD